MGGQVNSSTIGATRRTNRRLVGAMVGVGVGVGEDVAVAVGVAVAVAVAVAVGAVPAFWIRFIRGENGRANCRRCVPISTS